MRKFFLGFGLVAVLFFGSCITTTKFTAMQVAPIQPVLNINPDQYTILGEAKGVGEGATYEQAKDAALGNAIELNKEADAIILPKFETEVTRTQIPYIGKPVYSYKVIVYAKAVKIK